MFLLKKKKKKTLINCVIKKKILHKQMKLSCDKNI